MGIHAQRGDTVGDGPGLAELDVGVDKLLRLFAAEGVPATFFTLGETAEYYPDAVRRYGELFERRIMDLAATVGLADALDLCWRIMAEVFEPRETGIRTALCERFWPQEGG